LTWLDRAVVELVLALEEYSYHRNAYLQKDTSENNTEVKSDKGTIFQPTTNFNQVLVNEKDGAFNNIVDVSV